MKKTTEEDRVVSTKTKPAIHGHPFKESPADRTRAEEIEDDGWDGLQTAIALSRPVWRDAHRNDAPVGPGDPCVGWTEPGTKNHHPCTEGPNGGPARDHQFHVNASFTDGQWRGPEAEHVVDLIALGLVAGSRESRQRTDRQARVDFDRGTNGTPDRPDGFPEYREHTTASLRHLIFKTGKTPRSADARHVQEKAEGASELKDMRDAVASSNRAVEALVEELREERRARRAPTEEA